MGQSQGEGSAVIWTESGPRSGRGRLDCFGESTQQYLQHCGYLILVLQEVI